MEVRPGAEGLGADADQDQSAVPPELNAELRESVGKMLDDIATFANTTWRTGGTPFYRDALWIPPAIKAAIDEHVLNGRTPGNFVQAVLENDLAAAVLKADQTNYLMLGAIVGYCFNTLPYSCWGTKQAVEYWQKHGGWNGINPNNQRTEVTESMRPPVRVQ
jgi:hypothetical protein